jgi:hypothetical protein
MKPYLCLLLLVAFECGACGRTNIEDMRKDVEAAFLSKSFLGIADKYGDSQPVRVILEVEEDPENPTVVMEFASVSKLSTWFFEKHEYSEHMEVPSPARCGGEGCVYEAGGLSLHHGVYLLGFEARKVGRSLQLTQLHIDWG